jgi:hypothetical protein
MRYIYTFFLLLYTAVNWANMASPLREGTITGSPFSSADVDILYEKINISMDKDAQLARCTVNYFIKADQPGMQIPLLFYAMDLDGDFVVTLDNKPVRILVLDKNISFACFTNNLNIFKNTRDFTVLLPDRGSDSKPYPLDALKYFEMKLSAGTHHVQVTYNVTLWSDRSDWLLETSFRYSLFPAKYWKSFGTLDISVTDASMPVSLTTGHLKPPGKVENLETVWHFDSLPGDYLKLEWKPKISTAAQYALDFGPLGFTSVGSIFMAVFFRMLLGNKPSAASINLSSLLAPFFVILVYMSSYDFIDSLIGIWASRNHGYTFFAMFFYPFLIPLFWITFKISSNT